MYEFEQFLYGKLIIQCPTREEADRLIESLEEYNVTWFDGEHIKDSKYNLYKEDTCYVLTEDIEDYGLLLIVSDYKYMESNYDCPMILCSEVDF